MRATSLTVRDFRNYERAALDLSPGPSRTSAASYVRKPRTRSRVTSMSVD